MADASSGKVPVVECVAASWRFLFAHWRLFLPAALVTAPFGALTNWLQATVGGGSMLNEAMAQLAASVPAMLASIAFTAAVLRKAVRDEFSGFYGLQFGADEFRLIGVAAGLLLLFLPLVILGGLALGEFVLNRLGGSQDEIQRMLGDPDKLYQALLDKMGSTGVMSLYLLILGAMALVLVVLSRFFILNAAATGERKVIFFQAWKWTSGNVLRIIAAIIITDLPAFLVLEILTSIAYGSVTAGDTISNPIAYAGWGGILQFIAAMAGIPLIALGAHLYKGLRPPDFVAK